MQSDLRNLLILILLLTAMVFFTKYLIVNECLNIALIISALIFILSIKSYLSPLRDNTNKKNDSDFIFAISNLIFDFLFLLNIVFSLFNTISAIFLAFNISSLQGYKNLVLPFSIYLEYFIFIMATVSICFGIVPAALFEGKTPDNMQNQSPQTNTTTAEKKPQPNIKNSGEI